MEIIRKESFQPDYTNILKVLYNERPGYLPLYEHHIDAPFISKALGREISAEGKGGDDLVEHYKTVIGLFGGFDMNELILNPYDYVYRKVLEEGTEFRAKARGYGLGSGNSIPEYASVEGFEAMVDAVKAIRRREK